MRGTPAVVIADNPHYWIIPAYAGNTQLNIQLDVWQRDHPRVCGEHNQSAQMSSDLTGSSPRMRGTRFDGYRANTGIGIIPAYAGNTPVPCFVDLRFRDHPRVCGEH